MSRIILTQHPGSDEHHIVVGWDRPLSTYFWQEFNKEPEVIEREDGRWVVKNYKGVKKQTFATKAEAEEAKWDDWEEMKGFGGYMPNEIPDIPALHQSAPLKVRAYITPEVERVLEEHAMSPNPGNIMVSMVPRSFKVECKTFGEYKWSSNAVRFATHDEADKAGVDLAIRWTMLEDWRVAPSDDPVNYKWEDGKAVNV